MVKAREGLHHAGLREEAGSYYRLLLEGRTEPPPAAGTREGPDSEVVQGAKISREADSGLLQERGWARG